MFKPQSKVILWRKVFNDANVGPWTELPDVKEHTVAGLKEWMLQMHYPGEKWDSSLMKPGGWDHHLWNYGLRLQFWIPDPEPIIDVVPETIIDAVVACDDACGVSLTQGKEYHVVATQDGLYEVEDDEGERRAFFKERFHRIKQMSIM